MAPRVSGPSRRAMPAARTAPAPPVTRHLAAPLPRSYRWARPELITVCHLARTAVHATESAKASPAATLRTRTSPVWYAIGPSAARPQLGGQVELGPTALRGYPSLHLLKTDSSHAILNLKSAVSS